VQRIRSLQRREARWFVPGEIAHELSGEPQRRTDAYHVPSLAASSSWKQRGVNGPLEGKVRVAARQIELAGVSGIEEQWVKVRCIGIDLSDEWTTVHKELWRTKGLEICQLTIDGDERWWSVAVQTDRWPGAPDDFAAWSDRLRDGGIAAAYPQWLLDRGGISARLQFEGRG
jgi:hypothetical protein